MGKQKTAPETKECAICSEERLVYRNFPEICPNDEPDTCLSCLSRHTITRLEEHRSWDACTCPQCGTRISVENLQAVLPRATAREMRALVDKAQRSSEEAWRWCLAPGCGFGSLQSPGKSQMIKCRKCGAKSCFNHQVPWHTGYTCEQYDISHPDSAVTKSNDDVIRKITKACPFCGWRIQKTGGCNHMHCGKCKRAWFWDQVAFDGEARPTAAEQVGGPEPTGDAFNVPEPEILQQIINLHNADIDRAERQNELIDLTGANAPFAPFFNFVPALRPLFVPPNHNFQHPMFQTPQGIWPNIWNPQPHGGPITGRFQPFQEQPTLGMRAWPPQSPQNRTTNNVIDLTREDARRRELVPQLRPARITTAPRKAARHPNRRSGDGASPRGSQHNRPILGDVIDLTGGEDLD